MVLNGCSLSLIQILQAKAGGVKASEGNEGSSDGNGYKTFLGHVYDLLEDKITTERYEEGVRQLVGNQVINSTSQAWCAYKSPY